MREDAYRNEVTAILVNGFVLGCSAEDRLAAVLDINFFTSLSESVEKRECSFANALTRLYSTSPTECADIVRVLSYDERWNVRAAVAAHAPSFMAEVFWPLAVDQIMCVRVAIASNLRTPIALLRRLARDPDHVVRYAVAQNPLSDTGLLEKLLQDPEPGITFAARRF